MNGTEPQGSAELTTDPSPPHKGKNRVQVKLTSSDRKPLPAAKITVHFFMAGMPEMGMAEMNVTSELTDRGNGVYAGDVELGSGGTWQVTIRGEQGGKTILTKRVNLTATGGM
jgi:nitrogen fixation protein FixH